MDDKVKIELTSAEALVLYEFVSRFSEDEKLEICDQSEERVLWDVCCILESTLVAPLNSDYDALLEAARDEPNSS